MDNLDHIEAFNNNGVSNKIYKELLKLIVSGKLPLGKSLPINELAEKFSVSNTPIREALNNLKSDGLLEKAPYSSYKIRLFTYEEVKEIYEARIAIESYASELAARKVDSDKKIELKKLQKEGEYYLNNEEMDKYREYNNNLHQLIVEIADNKEIKKVYNNFQKIIALIASQTVYISGRSKQAVKEHAQLVKHIINGEESKANEVTRKHIREALVDYNKEYKR